MKHLPRNCYSFFLFFCLVLMSSAWALPSLTLSSGNAVFYEGQSEMFVDSGVLISGNAFDVIDGARIIIGQNYNSIVDQLLCTNALGLSVAFDSSKGILSIDGAGNIQTYQEVLRSVKYKNLTANITATSLKKITMSLGQLLAFQGPDHTTFHYYEFVDPPGIDSTWTEARDASALKSHFGLQGYLVTITSAEENAFASSKFSQNTWLGGSDQGVEGDWRWVTGPESGTAFWSGTYTGGPVGGKYNNWSYHEPNDYGAGEDYTHFYANGSWNDFPNGNKLKYLVEYGGMVGDPNINLVDSVQATIQENRAPTDIYLTKFGNPWVPGDLYENAMPNSWNVDIKVTDLDPGEFHNITFESTGLYPDNNLFVLSGNAYDGFVLTATGVFDYETTKFLNIRLRATEVNGENKYVNIGLTLPVANIEEPPVITSGLVAQSVNEDSGTLTFGITFSDPETVADNLIITLVPDNLPLVSQSNVFVSGNGGTRTVNITPNPNAYGSTNIILTIKDSNDIFTALSTTSSMVLTVNPVNDAPTHSVLSAVNINEDNSTIFSGAQTPIVADIDATTMEISLSVSHGRLSCSGLAGLTFSSGDGVADSSMVFQGSLSSINSALNGLSYTPDVNYYGPDTFVWKSSDLGQLGSGGTKTITTLVPITIAPINDAPILVSGNIALARIDEDAAVGSGNSWQSLIDASNTTIWLDSDISSSASYAIVGSDNQQIGHWEISQNGGVTWSSLPTVTPNSALLLNPTGKFRFVSESNAFGEANIMIRAWDQSNGLAVGSFADTTVYSASGAWSSNVIVVTQEIRSINDAPIWQVPLTVNTAEDVPVLIGALGLSDIDVGLASANIEIKVWNGSLSLSSTTGLTFGNGDGVSDNLMAFSGNVQNVNNALSMGNFIPNLNFNGTALIQVSGNDLGNSGFGGAQLASSSFLILVNEVNDAPVLDTNITLALTNQSEDVVSSGHSVSTALTSQITMINAYSDVDRIVPNALPLPDGIAISQWTSGNGQWQVTYNSGGVWNNFPTDDGRSFLLRDDPGTAIRFLANSNSYGHEQLMVRAWDMTEGVSGNLIAVTTAGNATSAFSGNQSVLSLQILPVNDAPIISAPVTLLSTLEDVSMIFKNSGNAISLYDVESFGNNENLKLNLFSANGNLNLASTLGLSVSGSGSNLIATGNLTDLNNSLEGLQFTPYLNYFGTTSLVVSLNDQDLSEGNPLSSSKSVSIEVQAVNDAPTITWNNILTYTENIPLQLFNNNSLLLSDVDDTFLQGASLIISANVLSEDLLSADVSGTSIIANYDSSTGNLNLTGTDTIAHYQSVIQSIIFNHLSENPDREGLELQRQLLLQVVDGSLATNLNTNLAIQAIADAPLISSWNNTPAYIEDDSALILDNSVVITDSDSSHLMSATIQCSPLVNGDSLSVTGSSNISVAWSSTTGQLLLTGSALPSEYTQILRTVTYVSSSADPDNLGASPNRTLTLSVSDGVQSSSSQIILSVKSMNDAPSLTGPFSIAATEDQIFSVNAPSIFISDVDDFGSDMSLSLRVGQGNLILTNTSGITVLSGMTSGDNSLVLRGSKTALNSVMNSLSYLSYQDVNGSDALNVVVNDLGNTGAGGNLDFGSSISINISPMNDAPVLPNNGNYLMTDIEEDDTNSSGNSVTNLLTLSGNIFLTDVDVGAGYGIAIYASSNTSAGTWQYSLNQGGFWQNMTSLSSTHALLLDGDAIIRFVPASNFTGSANLSFRGWDRSNGHSSGAYGVNITSTGGTSAFSINSGLITIQIGAVNDAPIITVPSMQTLLEDDSLIITGLAFGDDDFVATDPLQVTFSVARGTISINGSAPQASLQLTDNLSNLNQWMNTGVVYQGLANDNGSLFLNIVANDLGQTGLGGTKTSSGLVLLNIDEVNDAPVLDPILWSDNVSIFEDDVDHVGWAPGEWCGVSVGSVSDVDLSISDNVWSSLGVAFTSMGNEVPGHWESSLNSGGSWTTLVPIGSGNAYLLSLQGEHRLRFVPDANANGNVSLKFRAWDRTVGVPGEIVNFTTTGGSSAFSQLEKSMIVEVIPVNDAPSILAATLPQFSNEDESVIFSLSQANGLRLEDIDLIDLPNAICQLELATSHANIQLASLNNLTILSGVDSSTSLRVSGNISDLTFSLHGLKLVPFKDYFGADVFTVTFYDLGQIGNTSLWHTINLDVNYLPVNDDPLWVNLNGDETTFVEGDLFATLDSGVFLSLVDVDSSDFDGGRLEVFGVSQGTRNDHLFILEDSDINTTGGSLNYQGNVIGFWSDDSQAQAALSVRFSSPLAIRSVVEIVAQSIRYSNNSQNPSSGTRGFSWRLVDGDGGESQVSTSLRVFPVNDDPVFVFDSGNTTLYTEDQGDWAILSGNCKLSDPDSADFKDGEFLLTWVSGQQSEDVWSFAPSGNFSLVGTTVNLMGAPFAEIKTLNQLDTVLELRWLSDQSTPERILELIKDLNYKNTSQKPDSEARILKMSISDGDGGLSGSLNLSFNIQAINDAPVLAMGLEMNIPSVDEDTNGGVGWSMAEIIALENNLVQDVDANPVLGLALELWNPITEAGAWQFRLEEGSWQPLDASHAGQSLLLRSGDRIRFIPNHDWFGAMPSVLRFRAWDRSFGLPAQWMNVTNVGGTYAFSAEQRSLALEVNGLPDAPVVVDGLYTGAKYAPRPFLWSEFVALFSDVDRDTLLSVKIDVLPSNGNLMLGNTAVNIGQVLSSADIAQLKFIPFGAYTGVDAFTWRALDSQGISLVSSQFQIQVIPVTADISMTNSVAEDVGLVTISIQLSAPSTAIVTLELGKIQESLLNYKDVVLELGEVQFPVGTTLWQRDMLIVDDLEVETTESMKINISQAQYCDIGVNQINFSVTDNDTAITGDLSSDPHIIADWIDPAWVRETGTSARLSIQLSQAPTAPLVLQPRSSDLGEGVLSLSSMSFDASNWNIPQILTVTGVPDQVIDGSIEAAILFYPSDDAWLAEPKIFTNMDMDEQNIVMLEPMPLTSSEGGGQTMLLLTLQQQPSDNVFLQPLGSLLDHLITPATLVFTPSDWMNPHVIIVKGLDNTTIEGDRIVPLSWNATTSNDVMSQGLRPRDLEILHKDNDRLNSINGLNLPPYRLILRSDHSNALVNERVMIHYDSQDPELVQGLSGGIVDFKVDLKTGSGFRYFEATKASTFAMQFNEAGIYKLELRAMDLLGAVSIKYLNLVIQSVATSPFTTNVNVISATAPKQQSLNWKDWVLDARKADVHLVEWDFDGDGIIDQHGFPGDLRLEPVTHTFEKAGIHRPKLRIMLKSGEVFSMDHELRLSAPITADPVLTLTTISSSNTIPAQISVLGTWLGINPNVVAVEWSFGEEKEFLWEYSTSALNVKHSYQKPGSYKICARATLNDGRQIYANTFLHLVTPSQQVAVWTGMSAKLAVDAPIGFGFPLESSVWPPQGEWLGALNTVKGSSLQNVQDWGAITLTQGQSISISSNVKVDFNGSSRFQILSREWNYQPNFLTQNGGFAQSKSISLPWQAQSTCYLNVHDGSSLLVPLLGLNGSQSVSMSLLGESGLTLQGIPPQYRNISRDVRFVISNGGEVETPSQPVILECAYDDFDQDGLLDNYGVSENDILAMRFDHELNRWVAVEYFMIQPLDNVVRIKTAHLSEFGLFISAERSVLPENSSGGGCFLK